MSNSSLRDRRFSKRIIVGWDARSVSSEAGLPAHIFRIPSPQSLSQSSASSKPTIIYLIYRLSEHPCLTMHDHWLIAGILDAGFNAFYDAARRPFVFPDKSKTAEWRQFGC